MFVNNKDAENKNERKATKMKIINTGKDQRKKNRLI